MLNRSCAIGCSVQVTTPRVSGTGMHTPSGSPAAAPTPDAGTSFPQMSSENEELGKRSCPFMTLAALRTGTHLPRSCPFRSTMNASRTSISGWASKKALACWTGSVMATPSSEEYGSGSGARRENAAQAAGMNRATRASATLRSHSRRPVLHRSRRAGPACGRWSPQPCLVPERGPGSRPGPRPATHRGTNAPGIRGPTG